MLIEQIIEFEWRGPWPPGHTYTSNTTIAAYFRDETKISKKIFQWIIIYCENLARDNMPYFPLLGPNHSQNLAQKC